jgi:putative nucleotidyltransferase with HDIG domain
MVEIRKFWTLSRKNITNLSILAAGIIIVLGIWPPEEKDSLGEFLGSILIVSSCFIMLYMFLAYFRPEILEVTRKTLFIILIIIFFTGLSRYVIYFAGTDYLYLIPYAIIPIVLCTFYDARLALFSLMIALMMTGFIVPSPFRFLFANFIAGVAAIFSLANIYRRGRLFYSFIAVIMSYMIIHFAETMINGEGFSGIYWSDYLVYLGNGILIILSYPIILLFERQFYFLSDATLLELSNFNNPLLRKFSEGAPGSFQHSLQVANLAEEAARATGANPLLVRTGALYHDVGKIINSGYYIENQNIQSNPHQVMDPVVSAEIIMNHVSEGVKLAQQYKLPVQIIDFIRTHHGTTKVFYFYMKYLEKNKLTPEMEKRFVYPGPKPSSRETAIVMMADAVEAASRTLTKFTDKTIGDLIERIIGIQEKEDQFSNSPLTFRELSEIKAIFKNRLLIIHHRRTIYPEIDFTGG